MKPYHSPIMDDFDEHFQDLGILDSSPPGPEMISDPYTN